MRSWALSGSLFGVLEHFGVIFFAKQAPGIDFYRFREPFGLNFERLWGPWGGQLGAFGWLFSGLGTVFHRKGWKYENPSKPHKTPRV